MSESSPFVRTLRLDIPEVSCDTDFTNDDVLYAPVTRFNLRIYQHEKSRHLEGRHLPNSPQFHDYWQQRTTLFRETCLPSVLNLNPRPHQWFILFHNETSIYIEELLQELSDYQWIRPLFIASKDTWKKEIVAEQLIAAANMFGKPTVCSTRFDSDDSLHGGFYGTLDHAITRIRQEELETEPFCLNPVFGLLDNEGSRLIYLRETSMFLSVVEKLPQIRGPHQTPHPLIGKNMPVFELLTSFPMWIYRRHENTLEPKFGEDTERLRLPQDAQLDHRFGMAGNRDPASLWQAAELELKENRTSTAEVNSVFFERIQVSQKRPRATYRQSDVAYALVTRFNIVWDIPERSKHLEQRHLPGSDGYDEYWRRRIDLFVTFCLPSVLNLKPRPHLWLIGFNSDTSREIEALLKTLSTFPWIKPFFVDQNNDVEWESALVAPELERLSKDRQANLLFSSRLDSDDSLHERYFDVMDNVVERLRRSERVPGGACCVDPMYGLMDVDEGLTVMIDSATQFAGIVENPGSIKGPYQGNHHRINNIMPLVGVLTSKPLWLYRKHGEGIITPSRNAPNSIVIRDHILTLKEFGIDLETEAVATFQEEIAGIQNPVEELLLLDKASIQFPENSAFSATRDESLAHLGFNLDVDEQFDLSPFAAGYVSKPDRALVVVSEALPVAGTVASCKNHDRALRLRNLGFEVAVNVLPTDSENVATGQADVVMIDDIAYFHLPTASASSSSADAEHSATLFAVAEFTRVWSPSLLVADDNVKDERIAAAIARAFKISVIFSSQETSAQFSLLDGPQVNKKRRPNPRPRSTLPQAHYLGRWRGTRDRASSENASLRQSHFGPNRSNS